MEGAACAEKPGERSCYFLFESHLKAPRWTHWTEEWIVHILEGFIQIFAHWKRAGSLILWLSWLHFPLCWIGDAST